MRDSQSCSVCVLTFNMTRAHVSNSSGLMGPLPLNLCWALVFLLATPTWGYYTLMSWNQQGFYLTARSDGKFELTPGPITAAHNFQRTAGNMRDEFLYTIKTGVSSNCSNMCLDIAPYLDNIPAVTQADCNPGRLTQYWNRTAASSGAHLFYSWVINYGTGNCMTAETWTSPPYVDAYPCTDGAENQIWYVLNPADPNLGGSTITNQAFSTCLQVDGASPRSGARTSAATCIGGAFYQRFTVSRAPTPWGYHTFTTSDGMLDGTNSNNVIWTPYQFFSLGQQWIAGSFPNEGTVPYKYLVNLSNGFCLTMDPNNLANIITSACIGGNPYQQWQVTG